MTVVKIGEIEFSPRPKKHRGKAAPVLVVSMPLQYRPHPHRGEFGIWRSLRLGERIAVLFGAEVGFVLNGKPPLPPAKDD